MSSSVLVALQIAALAAVVAPWQAANWNDWGWPPLLAGAIVGVWTLAHNRLGNFSIFPEPRRNARLVTGGPYRYVRHPMYVAVLLFALGFAAGWGYWVHWSALAVLGAVLHAKASREERLLAARFPEYADYASRTPRFLPSVK